MNFRQSKKNLNANDFRFEKTGNNIENNINIFIPLVNKSVQKFSDNDEPMTVKNNKSERGINIFNQKKNSNDSRIRNYQKETSLQKKSIIFLFN